MPTPPCPIPPPLPPAGARAPAPSHAAAGHSYSASLPPTYRLSAFPVSPSATNDDQGSFSTLAPGLGLEQRGSDSDADADDDDDDDDTGHRRPRSPPSPSTPLSPSSHRPTRTTRGFDCPGTSPASAPATAAASSGIDLRSTSASSARSSSSCTDTSASTSTTTTEDDVDECATPLSSLAGSTASMTASESCRATAAPGHAPTTSSSAAAPRPPLTSGGSGSNLAARLEWGMQGLVVAPQVPKDDAAKREREARAVRGGWEDPALAAARRALWDDVVAVEEDEGAPLGEVGRASGEEGTAERRPGQGDGEAGVSVRRDDDDAGDDARDGDEEEDRGDDDEGLPRPRRPCHTTLAPRFSCLRHSPSARASLSLPSSSCPSSSDDGPLPPSTSTSTSPLPTSGRLSPSAASTSSTSEGAPASVTFSCAPPETCPTWSAEAYSRRGDAPVEKLSIREWIELQGVREAVGVWSGKIAKWDEAQVLAEASAGGDGQLSTPTRGRPPGGLAAVVGVVHISRSTPTSPVDPNRMPFP